MYWACVLSSMLYGLWHCAYVALNMIVTGNLGVRGKSWLTKSLISNSHIFVSYNHDNEVSTYIMCQRQYLKLFLPTAYLNNSMHLFYLEHTVWYKCMQQANQHTGSSILRIGPVMRNWVFPEFVHFIPLCYT